MSHTELYDADMDPHHLEAAINEMHAYVYTIKVGRDVPRAVPCDQRVECEVSVHLGHHVKENATQHVHALHHDIGTS
eukprot:46380-Eustigmatos_ZCMA.PRE.1